MKRSLLKIILMIFVVFLFYINTFAVPHLINYQGILRDQNGNPLNGTYDMRFSIYDVKTGGTALWGEQQDSVFFGEGSYNVQLGVVEQLSLDIFDNDLLYLELQIYNTETSSWEIFSPRLCITSTAFSIKAGNADTVDGQHASDFVRTGQTDSITGGMIEDSSVSSSDLADNAVTSEKIQDNTIQPQDLAFALGDGHSLDDAYVVISEWSDIPAKQTDSAETYLIINTVIMEDHLTIPSNITVKFEDGGLIDFNEYTLKINGSIVAPQRRIFYGANSSAVEAEFGTSGGAERNPVVYAAWWGWDPNRGSDTNTYCLNKAVRSLQSGQILDLGAGEYEIDSGKLQQCGPGSAFEIPNHNITIRCGQKLGVKITVKGNAAINCGIFHINSKNGFKCENIHFAGNGDQEGGNNRYAIQYEDNSDSLRLGFEIYDCKFEDFCSYIWCGAYLYGGTAELHNIHIERNIFIGGNDPNPSNLNVGASQIRLQTFSNDQYLKYIWIKDNYCDANEVKNGIVVKNKADYVWIQDNYIENAGRSKNAIGAYAIMLYNTVEKASITGNKIYKPKSCGMYLAEMIDSEVIGNYVYGQSDDDDAANDNNHAGITIEGCARAKVIGNTVDNCRHGITVQPKHTIAYTNNIIADNNVFNCTEDGIRLRNANSGVGTYGTIVHHNTVTNSVLGITFDPHPSGGHLVDISIIDNILHDNTTAYQNIDDSRFENVTLITNKYGNIGIGTNNPGKKLEVKGDIKATNSIFAGLKSGTTQVNAGATAGEMWVDTDDYYT